MMLRINYVSKCYLLPGLLQCVYHEWWLEQCRISYMVECFMLYGVFLLAVKIFLILGCPLLAASPSCRILKATEKKKQSSNVCVMFSKTVGQLIIIKTSVHFDVERIFFNSFFVTITYVSYFHIRKKWSKTMRRISLYRQNVRSRI